MNYLYTILLVLLAGNVFGQQATLRGSVQDAAKNEAVEFATITLRDVSDSSKVSGGKSKAGGAFLIEKIPFGKYTITVSSIGYKPKTFRNYLIDKITVDLGLVTLDPSDKSLKEVNIKGEKSAIEIGIDKKTFNVDKNITAAGGTATDLLRNVPSVSVDMDGNLSLRGKDNVTLLVDGKPSAMFGSDPQTALQAIPASSIESIEVITNPSSKYEAQGMGGIINIILKKDRKAGYNGMFNVGLASPYRLNGGINLNANRKRWNYFINANAQHSKVWEETRSKRDNYDDQNTYRSFNHNDREPMSIFMNLGAEYRLDNRNKITLSQNLFNANMRGNSTNWINNEVNYIDPVSSQLRKNKYVGKPLGLTTNLQYKHNFKQPKEELNLELNFSKRRYIRESVFDTQSFDSNGTFTNSFIQRIPVRGGNWNGTFQADYTRPLGKNGRLDLGERTYYIRFKSENQPTIQYLNQPEVPEAILKNHFEYTQQVHGAYANLANQWKSTGIQAGLRAEYFTYSGTVHQYNAKVQNDYLSLFPTLFISQKISSKEDLNLNYARRVNRPGFMQLIPFIDVTNPLDTSMGNPDLTPEFIHAVELTYNYQYSRTNSLMVSAYYQYTNDLIQRYRRFNDNGTTFSQNRNLATGTTYGVELTQKHNLLSWWDATINLNLFRNHIDGANLDPTLSRSGYGGFMKLISNTKLKHGFNVQVTANYNAPTVISQGSIDAYGNVDFAIKKSFFHNLATLTFTAADIFNTIQTRTHYNLYPFYNQEVLRKNQTRSIGINLQIKLASKTTEQSNGDATRKQTAAKKEKEGKSRDENLKKDEGGGDENSGGSKENR